MAIIEKRKSERDGVVYRAKIRLKGFPPQSKTFRRLTDAKMWIQETEIALRDGKIGKQIQGEKKTVGDLIDRYINTYLCQKSLSTQDAQFRHLTWWRRHLGSRCIKSVTPALLIEYRDKLAAEIVRNEKKRSGATCNRYMAAIGHALTIACKEWQWLDGNPMMQIRKLKESGGRVLYLKEEEQKQLLQICRKSRNHYLYFIVLLGISTGMRLNEIRFLTWGQVDLKQGTIILNKTKNYQPRRVPLQGIILQEIREFSKIRRIDSDLLFPSESNPLIPAHIRTAWEHARDKAGLQHFRFHDLRHTAASYYAMSGATTRDLCDIFGWKTMQMAMRYAHLSESHTRELAERMNERFIAG